MAKPTHTEKEQKRVALAVAFRRAILNGRKREAVATDKAETKAERSHENRKARRERTNKLAAERIDRCRKYPSPHAARQLGEIAGRSDLNGGTRVEAASTLLQWANPKIVDPIALASAKRQRRPARPKVPRTAKRLHL